MELAYSQIDYCSDFYQKNRIINDLQKLKTASYVVLDTELPKTGKRNSRWSIQQNLDIETIKSAMFT